MRRQRQTANELTRRLAIPGEFPITFAYVPVSFVDDDVILDDTMLAIGNASYYHFGILSSAAHVAWLCCVARPKGATFIYTPNPVYNSFVWPEVTEEQRAKIESAARLIESTRMSIPDFTFARHYAVDGMPPALKAAHRINDEAVFTAYGLGPSPSSQEVFAELLKRYEAARANYKPERPVRERPTLHWRRGE